MLDVHKVGKKLARWTMDKPAIIIRAVDLMSGQLQRLQRLEGEIVPNGLSWQWRLGPTLHLRICRFRLQLSIIWLPRQLPRWPWTTR